MSFPDVPRHVRAGFDPARFERWSAAALLAGLRAPARVDMSTHDAEGRSRNRILEMPELARSAYEHALTRGLRPGLLALRAEHVFDGLTREVAETLALPPPWFEPQLAVSISAGGSRTPLHADDADVAVLQLVGTRRWRVYAADDLAVDRAGLVLHSTHRLLHDRSWANLTPVCDVMLAPGDILFVPAFAPHLVDGSPAPGHLLSLSAIVPVVTAAHLARAEELAFEPEAGWFVPLHLPPTASSEACTRRLLEVVPALDDATARRLAAAHLPVSEARIRGRTASA